MESAKNGIDTIENGNKKGIFSVFTQKSTYCAQYMVTFAASLSMYATALSLGWSSPNLLILQSDASPIQTNDSQLAWITSCNALGIVFASSFLTVYLADTVGRRRTLLISILPSLVSFSLIFFATNIWMLYVARFFGGVTTAIVFVVLPTYISEISSPEIRGKLGMYSGVFIGVGCLTENCIVPLTSFYTNALICFILCSIFGVVIWFIPPSPYFSIIKNNEAQAVKTLKFLRQTDNVNEELAQLKSGWELEQKDGKCSVIDLVRTKINRKCLFIVLGVTVAAEFSGNSPLFSFIQIIINKSDPPISVSTCAITITLVGPIFHLLMAHFMDSWGRRISFTVSAIGCALGLSTIGTFFVLQSADIDPISSLAIMTPIGFMIFIFAYSIGLCFISKIYTSELFAVKFKAKAGTVVTVFDAILSIGVTQFYEELYESFGIQFSLFIFAFVCTISAIFGFIFLPETKTKSLEEIQLDLRKTTS